MTAQQRNTVTALQIDKQAGLHRVLHWPPAYLSLLLYAVSHTTRHAVPYTNHAL